jgi:acyl carrier protein
MKRDTLGEIISYVARNFNGNKPVAPDDSLTGEGIISSLSLIELICWLEETYRLSIPPEDFLPENFDSINAIGKYVFLKGTVNG